MSKLPYTPRVENLLIRAQVIAKKQDVNYLSTEHIILALLDLCDGNSHFFLNEVLNHYKITTGELRIIIERKLQK